MAFDGSHKASVSVLNFAVKVLGGTFHVRAVLVNDGETPQSVRTLIQETPADRWFVMVADDAANDDDALAMIDDNLEFQIHAHGVLRQD